MATRARHYVSVQSRQNRDDGQGGFISEWSAGTRYPMEIVPIKASQQFQFRSVNVDATHRLYCRGNITINEKTDRILFGSRVFEILTVENLDERGIEQVLTCKEAR